MVESGVNDYSRWLHRFALFTAAATLGLIAIGGLVTSKGAGMAVPDWPTSYGYNMFALPIHFWRGGVFYEHTHRLWASMVGVLVVALTRWLGGGRSRLPLGIVAAIEILAGIALFLIWPNVKNVKGAGYFLTGIGGVVMLAALLPVRNQQASRPLVALGWTVFFLVQLQGLLGGLRVVLYQDPIGIFHAGLAQLFFILLCVIALLTSKRWPSLRPGIPSPLFRTAAAATTALIFCQLMVGATMRHQHAGLAVPDFPLAYGRLWPATDPESILKYNQHRVEVTAVNPITAAQVNLHMAHRAIALLILLGTLTCAFFLRRQADRGSALTRWMWLWLGMIIVQATLGAVTVWTDKAADVATAHVVVGAVSLATGAIVCILCFRSLRPMPAGILSPCCETGPSESGMAAESGATT